TRRIEQARAAVPGLNLTGDVIVGFPPEDGAAFARTLAAVEELGFSPPPVFGRVGARLLASARVPVLAAAGHAHGRCGSRSAGRQAAPRRAAAGALRPPRPPAPGVARRPARPRAGRARGRRWTPARLRCRLHRVRVARA